MALLVLYMESLNEDSHSTDEKSVGKIIDVVYVGVGMYMHRNKICKKIRC